MLKVAAGPTPSASPETPAWPGERAHGPELVKFMPRYRLTASGSDGSEVTFLLRGEYVKLAGVAYGCSEDIEKLVERALGTATDHGR